MSQTLDAAGNFHDGASKFAGRRQGESDPKLLGAPCRTGQQVFYESHT
jgi:hypothetical protein